MIAGIVFIVCGLLIAFFPHLLSIIVASVLVLIGVLILAAAYEFRRNGTADSTQIIRYIIRH